MPDQPSALPSLLIASTGVRRPREDPRRRRALLDAAVLRWLLEAGWPPDAASAQTRALGSTASQWLAEAHPERMFDLLPVLVDRLRAQLPQPAPPATAFFGAFAHSLLLCAVNEVTLEARRAGHANVFAALLPYLNKEPSRGQLAELCVALQLSDAALAIALSRLRRRLRERIEAGLAVWASNPETRNILRRQLRESLIGTEPDS